jgi:hypothetical protein
VPDLEFAVEGAAPVPHSVAPTLGLKLRISDSGQERIDAVQLTCQIRIEAQRRRYQPAEKERLFDLFGEPSRWSQTLRSLLWTHVSVNVPAFTSSTVVELPVPCTYDFNVLAGRYFYALESDDVPLLLLFSGTIFFREDDGGLQVGRVSWSKEARCQLPVATWKSMMEMYYPNSAWLCLRKDVFDRLAAYKSRQGLPTWDQALESLLPTAEESRTR